MKKVFKVNRFNYNINKTEKEYNINTRKEKATFRAVMLYKSLCYELNKKGN